MRITANHIALLKTARPDFAGAKAAPATLTGKLDNQQANLLRTELERVLGQLSMWTTFVRVSNTHDLAQNAVAKVYPWSIAGVGLDDGGTISRTHVSRLRELAEAGKNDLSLHPTFKDHNQKSLMLFKAKIPVFTGI